MYSLQKQWFIGELIRAFWDSIFSIYEIWEFSIAGVSDIDLLIVINRNIDHALLREIRQKYDLIDVPIVVDKDKIDDFSYITHHYIFTHIYWNTIVFPSDVPRELLLIYWWKVLFFSLLRNFYYCKNNRKINIKVFLSWVYDIRYPIYYLQKLNGRDFSENLDHIEKIRIKIKSHSLEVSDIVLFLEEMIDLSWTLIDEYHAILLPYLQWSHNKPYLLWRYPTLFTDSLHCRELTQSYFKIMWVLARWDRFLVLPNTFSFRRRNQSLIEKLDKICLYNRSFLRLSFDSKVFMLLLTVKKLFDFIKIKIYQLIIMRKWN